MKNKLITDPKCKTIKKVASKNKSLKEENISKSNNVSYFDPSLPPGTNMSPGSELDRIKRTNPQLWSRILNWD